MNHARRRVGTGGWARLALLLGLAGLGACDRSPGASIGCDTDGDCADGDECTADACGGDGLCRYAPADLDGDGYGARCGGGDDSDDHDPTVHPGAVERCDDGRDQDSDGLVDCDDPDCARDPACWQPPPEICDNGFDDDGDGLLDCEDPECEAAEACCVPAAEACDDGRDNDCDGVADCDDPDCAGHAACALDTPEVCDDWVDNDGDLFVDCLDPDCATDPACVLGPEQCGNGIDDDGDDLADCEDPDCAGAVGCGGAACALVREIPCGWDVGGEAERFQAVTGLYSCGGEAMTGAEWVALFRATSGWWRDQPPIWGLRPFLVTVEIVETPDWLVRDQVIRVLDAGATEDGTPVCDPGQCLATSEVVAPDLVRARFVADPAHAYYLVIEDPAPEPTTFGLRIGCTELCAPEVCDDGFDNDCDGLVDCHDPECVDAPGCGGTR